MYTSFHHQRRHPCDKITSYRQTGSWIISLIPKQSRLDSLLLDDRDDNDDNQDGDTDTNDDSHSHVLPP
jgi:hypothetical protein